MNAATQNTWTSYRDGRRVMHYMRADKGRYFVQKVEVGYAVTFLADEGDGVSVRLSTEATLAAGKKWVAAHLAAAPTKERGKSFLENSARQLGVSYTGDTQMVGRATREIPPGTHTAQLNSVELAGNRIVTKVTIIGMDHAGTFGGDLSVGFGSRYIQIAEGRRRNSPHRPKTYRPYALGIDTFKVLRIASVGSVEQANALMAQDARVCAIEQELVQYAGKRRTPHRDRKVAKLRRILRTLKRGIYE